jgi:hypothetical protein
LEAIAHSAKASHGAIPGCQQHSEPHRISIDMSFASPPRVRSGQIIAMRLFDVAYAIDLKRAEAIWALRQPGRSARSRLQATPPKAVSFGVPPLALELEPVTLPGEAGLQATLSVRLHDFGVAALTLRLPVTDIGWDDYVALLNRVDQSVGADAPTTLWAETLATLREVLDEALDRPSTSGLEEDYLIGMVREFDTTLTAETILQHIDLAPLLSGEQRRLSEGARQDLLRNRFSYYTDDLVAIAWDRAFIWEPRGENDVIDVLEVANAQLLEMRYYDELLDDELPRIYDLVEATQRSVGLLASRRYAQLARRLHGLVAEVTELTERVDNALQVTEDVYLARVYAAAMELFRVPNVSAAVDRKLSIIRDTYSALYSEAHSGRAEVLEISILLLIFIEIVLSLVRG